MKSILMKTDEHTKPDIQKDPLLEYECEQALLRTRFKRPSEDEEWNRLEMRIRTADAARKKRQTFRRRAWATCIGIAAMTLLIVLMPWQRFGETGQDKIVLCDAQPPADITITGSSGNTPSHTAVIRPGQNSVKRQGAVLSARNADFTQAETAPEHTTVVTIPRGQVYQIVLSDSTRVWMNADSRLYFPSRFSGSTREVTLVGEAYFRVAKDKARPFIIHTRSMTTEVLGTEFNLRAYPDAETHVTLVEGSVKIQMPDIRHEIILRPGENVAYADSTFEVTRVNTRYCAMWKDGGLYFDNVPLKDILHDLGRHYNLTIRIDDDPALMQRRLHFVVDRDETVEEVIDNLNLFGYMSVSKNGQTITIQRKN